MELDLNGIYQGDSLEILKTLPSQSINTVVTSPPYYGLRDYGMNGQIGNEETPEEYIQRLVDVFREIKRVLKDDGTIWVNIGDTYCSTAPGTMGDPHFIKECKQETNNARKRYRGLTPEGMKPKDLMGIPWMLAFALRADGWFLRQDIIWHKPNPMPESVRDRCTKAHEYIFLLSKSQMYYYDNESIKEPTVYPTGSRKDKQRGDFKGKYHAHEDFKHISDSFRAIRDFRNKRDVWTVATKPFKGAHFATFPPELIEPCILAGCPKNGVVLDPFFGSGTTGLVATKHNRNFVGIELNPEYIKIAEKRLSEVQLELINEL
jgi:DNA modification methylase